MNLPEINPPVNSLALVPPFSSFPVASLALSGGTLPKSDCIGGGGVSPASFSGPLGNTYEITQPPPEDARNDSVIFRMKKWANLRTAQGIINRKRFQMCHRGIAPLRFEGEKTVSREWVEIQKTRKENFYYSGLMCCGSVWVCPVDAPKIAEHKKNDLVTAMNRFSVMCEPWGGGSVFHLVLTAPHHAGESLKSLSDRVAHSMRLMLNRKPWKHFEEYLRLLGRIRALEVTHSFLNGWHVHFHMLLLSMASLDDLGLSWMVQEWMDEQKARIFPMWREACKTAGLDAPSWEHGVNFESGESAGAYVAKWGASDELTKGHIKKGRDGNLSPFQMLDAIREGDLRYVPRFQEFDREFLGRKQLVWSRGLRKKLELADEIPDEIIAETPDPDAKVFYRITKSEWGVVLHQERRGELLEACRGGIESAKAYVDRLVLASGRGCAKRVTGRRF